MEQLDGDPTFEPQTRARSNTWPLPRPDNFVDPEAPEDKGAVPPGGPGTGEPPKKNSSRRNAWGNMSYADLITQAIQSAPDQRLTLAQIYEWMVQNVAYFKDKGDSNSSAGWKNSIRHNLSLHNRFMRVQNEGTGKSSWWMINPDAKPGKAARRRATSMETQKYEKKRGRVKKKVEALRNGATPSPSSSVSEGQDLFPDSPVHHGFQLSPDFRPRASSNASSCGGGRLSPIPAVDSDMQDSDLPPLSPIGMSWNTDLAHLGAPFEAATAGSGSSIDRFTADNLVKTLAESMKLRNGGDPDGTFARLADCAVKPLSNGGRPSPQLATSGGQYTIAYTPQHYGSNGQDYRPPSYHQQTSPQDTLAAMAKRNSSSQQQVIESVNGRSYNNLSRIPNISGLQHGMQVSVQQQMDAMPSAVYRQASYLDTLEPLVRGQPTPQQQQQQALYKTVKEERLSPLLGTCNQQNYMYKQDVKEERLSPLLGTCSQQAPAPSYHQHMMNQQQSANTATSLVNTAHVVGHLLYNPFPQDLDFEPLPGALECDVDQVIRHELSVDGNLDFNFDPAQMNGSSSNSQHHQTAISTTRSWVH